MKEILSAIALCAAALVSAGCRCTEVSCYSGINLQVGGLRAAVSAGSKTFPLTVKVCADSSCQDLTITNMGGTELCESSHSGTECSVDGDGALVGFLYVEAEGNPTISVDVKDSTGT